jgi:integrase/recombinase XerD
LVRTLPPNQFRLKSVLYVAYCPCYCPFFLSGGQALSRPRQYAERVNVLKQVKLNSVWRLAPVLEKNGKIMRDQVKVAGRVERHPEGKYFLEWYQQGRRKRQSVQSFDQVVDLARKKSIELNALKNGIIEQLADTHPLPERMTIGRAIDAYLEFIKAHRKLRTYLTYRYTLDTLLRDSYKKSFVDQVTRQDIIDFMTHCYQLGLGKRTVYDKLVVVLQLFKRNGKSGLVEANDWPDYVETIRPIYEAEELEALFKVASDYEATLIKFLLGSGFRDQEIRYVLWRDVDFKSQTVRVTAKPQWSFTPKNWEERAVPIPAGLLGRLRKLKTRREAAPTQLVFPNSRGNPDSEMDAIVKRLAYRARLNCGHCITEHGNKCADGPYCKNFFLHKFRHTFATEHLRHGVDIRTLQSWMGHRDIKSTMVYLKGVQSKDALEKVNAGALAAYVS